jgi:TIR domain
MKEIFLGYSRLDSSTVQALAAVLEEKGLSVWIDRSGIEEGDAYDTQIEDAIAQTRVVIVVWSQHSVKSHWVRAEGAPVRSTDKHQISSPWRVIIARRVARMLPSVIGGPAGCLGFGAITVGDLPWQRNCTDLVVQKSGMPTQLIDRGSQILNRRVVKSAYYLHKMFKRFCL